MEMTSLNLILIVLAALAILLFMYFIIKRNYKDQKEFENEINQKEVKPDQHSGDKI